MHSYTQLQLLISIARQEKNTTKMKTLILIFAVAALTAASPLPVNETDVDEDEPAHQENVQLDLEELDLEFFPNGTVKLGSLDDLLRLYYDKKYSDDFSGKKTEEHFELEDDDPDENDRSKRTVFDDDERLPVPDGNLGLLPFCALAEVSNGCTAVFVGPNHALTAGRCVYDRVRRQFRTGLRLYRGRNCRRFGTSMTQANLFTVNGYANSGFQEYDYGMIVTRERSPCWASFGYNDPWNNRGFDLIGYPTDKRAGCFYNPLYFASCTTSSAVRNDLFLQHRCDTSGMIGAPLMTEFVDRLGVDRGERGVTGINVYTGSVYNYGPRFNRDRFFTVIDWMRRTGYNPR